MRETLIKCHYQVKHIVICTLYYISSKITCVSWYRWSYSHSTVNTGSHSNVKSLRFSRRRTQVLCTALKILLHWWMILCDSRGAAVINNMWLINGAQFLTLREKSNVSALKRLQRSMSRLVLGLYFQIRGCQWENAERALCSWIHVKVRDSMTSPYITSSENWTISNWISKMFYSITTSNLVHYTNNNTQKTPPLVFPLCVWTCELKKMRSCGAAGQRQR